MTNQDPLAKIKTAIEQGYQAGNYSGYGTDPTPTTILTLRENVVKKYSKFGEVAKVDNVIKDQFRIPTADYNKALEELKNAKQQTVIEKVENEPAPMPVQNYQPHYDIPRGTEGTETSQVSNSTPSPFPPLIFIGVILIGGLWLISR